MIPKKLLVSGEECPKRAEGGYLNFYQLIPATIQEYQIYENGFQKQENITRRDVDRSLFFAFLVWKEHVMMLLRYIHDFSFVFFCMVWL